MSDFGNSKLFPTPLDHVINEVPLYTNWRHENGKTLQNFLEVLSEFVEVGPVSLTHPFFHFDSSGIRTLMSIVSSLNVLPENIVPFIGILKGLISIGFNFREMRDGKSLWNLVTPRMFALVELFIFMNTTKEEKILKKPNVPGNTYIWLSVLFYCL